MQRLKCSKVPSATFSIAALRLLPSMLQIRNRNAAFIAAKTAYTELQDCVLQRQHNMLLLLFFKEPTLPKPIAFSHTPIPRTLSLNRALPPLLRSLLSTYCIHQFF